MAQNSLGNVYTSVAWRDYRYAQFASLTGEETLQRFRQNASSYDKKAVAYFEAMLSLAHRTTTEWLKCGRYCSL